MLAHPLAEGVENIVGGPGVAVLHGQVVELVPPKLELVEVGLEEVDVPGIKSLDVGIKHLAGVFIVE